MVVAVSIEDLQWRTVPVRLELTVWRQYEFSFRRYTDWMDQAEPGPHSHDVARFARYYLQRRAKESTPIYADPHAYFVEVHRGDQMPWFIAQVERWFRGLGSRPLRQDGHRRPKGHVPRGP